MEAVFRSLKSELGLRPVFHQITDRGTGQNRTTITVQCKNNDVEALDQYIHKQAGQDIRCRIICVFFC